MNDLNAKLCQPLDPADIKQRKGGGGGTFSYIEGHVVKRHLNEVFGHTWSYASEVSCLHEPYFDDAQKKWYVSYMAKVTITVMIDMNLVTREDYGYGNATDANLSNVFENAIKEAVTDGLKRAANSFGSYLGLDLYDKEWLKDAANGEVKYNERNPDQYAPKRKRVPDDASEEMVKSEAARIMKDTGLDLQTRKELIQALKDNGLKSSRVICDIITDEVQQPTGDQIREYINKCIMEVQK